MSDLVDTVLSYVLSAAVYAVPVVVALALIVAAASFAGFGVPRGESQYNGVVVDIERDSGVVFRTTEVHMRSSPQASTTETFCIREADESTLLPTLRDSLQNGSDVTITYSRGLFVSPLECNSSLSVVQGAES